MRSPSSLATRFRFLGVARFGFGRSEGVWRTAVETTGPKNKVSGGVWHRVFACIISCRFYPSKCPQSWCNLCLECPTPKTLYYKCCVSLDLHLGLHPAIHPRGRGPTALPLPTNQPPTCQHGPGRATGTTAAGRLDRREGHVLLQVRDPLQWDSVLSRLDRLRVQLFKVFVNLGRPPKAGRWNLDQSTRSRERGSPHETYVNPYARSHKTGWCLVPK